MGGPLLPRAAGGKGGPVYTQATLIITLAAGFATGMLSGYLYHQHHQVSLLAAALTWDALWPGARP
jgi:ABC-type uncharacterized transport system permease subunit